MFELDSAQVHVVQQWVLKAEHDLTTATLTLKAGKAAPTDTICFHAQQCVEKYLKALLSWHGIESPKTHNIKKILAPLPSRVHPELTIAEQERLTEFATVTRYPGDYEPITLTEARRAVTLARRVPRQARGWLPKQALTA
jgi:HEPN domain-containing protein